jgi:hypothetical protein
MEELEKINRGLKIYVNGDKFDATSLLRIPGTRNHKYPGSPMVRVERGATKTHTPESLMEIFPVPEGTISGVELAGLKLPEIPEGFTFGSNAEKYYFKLRREVRNWNGRYEAGNTPHRYAAAIAIVKEAIKYGLSVDDAYAFAMHCEPLLDKQAEENGYDIQKDIAKTYYRETKTQSSGMTVEEFTREADQSPAVPEPRSEDRPTTPVPATFTSGSMPHLGDAFPFTVPNLDELLSGDYVPLEPTMVPCGSYFLLYPGKSHGLSSDRGVGKTNITIAMIHLILKGGGRVAYFDFEDAPDTFIRDRMMNQHGITEEMIRTQFLYIGGLAPLEAGNMSPSEAIQFLAEQLGGAKWDLVVIDGVAASMNDWSMDEECPVPMLDGSKATDYAWWHSRQIKPFLDKGIATLQIDHTTKNGGRVSGTLQKGAKLTGVEYELRAEKIASSLVMGGTGRLVLAAVKDRVGRILRYKRRHVPAELTEVAFNDVAVFVMTSDINGRVTRAEFEPVNDRDHDVSRHTEGSTSSPSGPVLSDQEQRALDIITGSTGPLNKSAFAKIFKGNGKAAYDILNALQLKGLIDLVEGARGAKMIVPVTPSHTSPSPKPGEQVLDFTQTDPRQTRDGGYKPRLGEGKLECRNCGDMVWAGQLVQPDEVGYNPKRRKCKACLSENIDSESTSPQDGPDWARGIRERITGRRTRRSDNERP